MIVQTGGIVGSNDAQTPVAELLHHCVRALGAEAADAGDFPAEEFARLLHAYRLRPERGSAPGTAADDWDDSRTLVSVSEHEVTAPAGPIDHTLGRLAFERGENAVVLLCGGMATRFGNMVKALAEALPGKRFLDLAMERILALAAASGCPIPVVVVTGPATHRPIATYVESRWPAALAGGWLRLVRQRVFPRVGRDGELLAAGSVPVFYPPGHGDMPASLVAHGIPDWLAGRGVRRVFTWGIDNLLAGPDPAIAGAHLRSGREVTVEVVPRYAGESGGQIFRRHGRIECVEDFRLAADTVAAAALLNTNSMVIDIEVLARPPALLFVTVVKTIDGRETAQFERLLGEITRHIDCAFLLVPRSGAASRFAPIKTQEDRCLHTPALLRLLREQATADPRPCDNVAYAAADEAAGHA